MLFETANLGALLLLAVAAARAQGTASCVSTPGVNLQLLSACESLRLQIGGELSPGAILALSTQVQLTPTETSSNINGFGTSAFTSGIAQTSATASSGGLRGVAGGFGESTSDGELSGSRSSSRESASQGFTGFGDQTTPTSSGTFQSFPSFVSSSAGSDFGLGATSTSAGSSPSDTTAAAAGGSASPSSSDAQSNTTSAAGSPNSDVPAVTEATDNSDPHRYRNTVVIPAAVVATIVPVLLLVLLACWLLRRRRKRKTRDSALLADAENEKFGNSTSTNHATAVGSAAPAARAARAAGKDPVQNTSSPFTDSAATNGYRPHGLGSGTATGLGAGALVGAGAAGISSHHHSEREPSAQGRSSMSSGRTPVGMKPSGITPAYSAYAPTASGPYGAPTGNHPGACLAAPTAAVGAAPTLPMSQDYTQCGPTRAENHLSAGSTGTQPSTIGSAYPSSGIHEPGNTGLGMDTAAAMTGGAGAVWYAAHRHGRLPLTPSNYSSAASQQEAFNDFSGGDTPIASSHVPQSGSTPRSSHPSSVINPQVGAATLGFPGANQQNSRPQQSFAATSAGRSDRPPTLPPMDENMGSGRWINPEFHKAAGGRIPQDPAAIAGSSNDDHCEGSLNRLNDGISPTKYSRPSALDCQANDIPTIWAAGLEDPFITPRSFTQSNAVSNPPPMPTGPMASSSRGPAVHTQPQFEPLMQQAQHRASSPLEQGSKASRVSGLDSGSGRASAAPRPGTSQQSPPTNSQGSPWSPPAVGEIKEGPFRGAAYTTPQIGLEEGPSSISASNTSRSTPLQPQSPQYTSYPTEDEVRSFDFGSASGNGEDGVGSFELPRKPVGGR